MSTSNQRVYFALSGGEVKIGVATDPLRRIKAMQAARPDIKLLVDIPGGRKTERELHQRFREFHIAGKWFHYANEIAAFVNKGRHERLNPPRRRSIPRATKADVAREYGISLRTIDH